MRAFIPFQSHLVSRAEKVHPSLLFTHQRQNNLQVLVKHFANHRRERETRKEGKFEKCDFPSPAVAFTVVLKGRASGNWCIGEA